MRRKIKYVAAYAFGATAGAIVFMALFFMTGGRDVSGSQRVTKELDRGLFNAEEFDWAQVRGKTVEKAVPSENGTRVTLGFTDGTHVELSSHKYTLSVN